MTITLRPDIERELQERVKDGTYQSPDEMINEALEQFLSLGAEPEFEPGELDRLLAAGEKQLSAGQFVTGEEHTRRRSEWSEAFRRNNGREADRSCANSDLS
jgi:Arc/MetJ-type ribon-helix-helix transcriptional regulator